jgi:hypothetical protein
VQVPAVVKVTVRGSARENKVAESALTSIELAALVQLTSKNMAAKRELRDRIDEMSMQRSFRSGLSLKYTSRPEEIECSNEVF